MKGSGESNLKKDSESFTGGMGGAAKSVLIDCDAGAQRIEAWKCSEAVSKNSP